MLKKSIPKPNDTQTVILYALCDEFMMNFCVYLCYSTNIKFEKAIK